MLRHTPLTAEQMAKDVEAIGVLVKGKNYRFSPPVLATAVSCAGPLIPMADEEFEIGWYLGYDERHVFQGRPVSNNRGLADDCKSSYFTVNFSGGSVVQIGD